MFRSSYRILVFIGLYLLAATAGAAEINQARALFHYQMFCQGCHTPDGAGANHVPPLKNLVGRFLETQAGREYLVRVPGSSTSKLNDENLAEVLNWIIENFAGSSVPAGGYRPFDASEIGPLRQRPLEEIEQYRLELLRLAQQSIAEESVP